MCLHRIGAVRGQPSAVVSGCVRWVTLGRTHHLPAPRGVPSEPPHQARSPTSRASVQKRARTVRPILFAFNGYRRLWAVSPRTRVSCLLSPRSSDSTPGQVVKGKPRLFRVPVQVTRPPFRWSEALRQLPNTQPDEVRSSKSASVQVALTSPYFPNTLLPYFTTRKPKAAFHSHTTG